MVAGYNFPPASDAGMQRNLSAYNLFVRAKSMKLKEENPLLPQGELMKKVGELWREMSQEEKAKWRVDGEEGSQVPGSNTFIQQRSAAKPSSYQMFVRAMTAELHMRHPENKQAENMRKIGEMWREMPPEERERYAVEAREAFELQQAQAQAQAQGHAMGGHYGAPYGATPFPAQKSAAKPSSYQMFVKAMSAELHSRHPENKQAENMRKIGELWRNMPPEERERYAQEAQAAHEQAQAQQAAMAQHYGQHPYGQGYAMQGGGGGGGGGRGYPGVAPGVTRTLSAYHLFVRHTLQQLKSENPGLEQGECMKKVGELWRAMTDEEKAKWRADGEQGSRVPGTSTYVSQRAVAKPSSYQMFVKQMTQQLQQQHPENKQAENMRKIGELWRNMPPEERERYAQEAQAAHEQAQAQQQQQHAAMAGQYGAYAGYSNAAGGGFVGGDGKRKRKKGQEMFAAEGQMRTLSAYNLFVRSTLQQLKQENPGLEQGECMKKVGELWRVLPEEEKAKWRSDGEQGSRVPGASTYVSQRAVAKPSSYQMFVKQMTQQLQQAHPENKQAENMRKIGELWRNMPPEERERYAQEAQAAHEQAQAQQAAMAQHYGNPYAHQQQQQWGAMGGPQSMRPDYNAWPVDGQQRTLSAYNLFVRAMLQKLKAGNPDREQGEYMKKVGEMWRDLPDEEKAKWRADGEEGSRVPGNNTYVSQRSVAKTSAYQMFVKHMTIELHQQHPENKQAENMRKIGELWRQMSDEEKAKWRVEDDPNGAVGMLHSQHQSAAARKKARKQAAQMAGGHGAMAATQATPVAPGSGGYMSLYAQQAQQVQSAYPQATQQPQGFDVYAQQGQLSSTTGFGQLQSGVFGASTAQQAQLPLMGFH